MLAVVPLTLSIPDTARERRLHKIRLESTVTAH
jgi:hypothetical protein